MQVPMTNPRTGEIKQVKVGWSWVLFLFSGFLGIPLFLRGLNALGAVFLVLWVVNLLLGIDTDSDNAEVLFSLLFQFVVLGLLIWIGIKGNEYTGKRLLDNGWAFADPDSDSAKFARMQWGLNFTGVGPAAAQRKDPVLGRSDP